MNAKLIKNTRGLVLNKVYSVDIYKSDFVDVYNDKNKRIGTWHIKRFIFE